MLFKTINVEAWTSSTARPARSRAEAGPAARLSRVVAPVPQPDPGAGRALPRHRARLSRLRQLRHARPGEVRLHVRPDLRDHRGVPRTRSGFTRFGLYVQDYGGPVGFRIVTRRPGMAGVADHPEHQRLRGRLHRRPGTACATRTGRSARPRPRSRSRRSCSRTTVKQIYLHGHRSPSSISPDNWNMDVRFLERPNARRVQLDLFYDYRTNVELYPQWQAFLRKRQPKTIIFWGQNDIFFTREGGEAYLRDLPRRRCTGWIPVTSPSRTACRTSSRR